MNPLKSITVSKTFFNIDNNNQKNVSWAANQYIRMISEGSCDTEDWSNDAENSDLITGIQYIQSQVTFIYIALLTIQIVSKQLHNIKIGK